MTHKINIITPPDKLFNNNYDFLLIFPSKELKNEFHNLLQGWDSPLNIYIYELDDQQENLDWLLSVAHIADTVIFDIDHSPNRIKEIASYIVANTNTYWLTNSANPVYNNISINRIYNLDFLKEEHTGGKFGKE